MTTENRGTNERMRGLDGLRAVALLGVVFFHLDTKPWIPGGFIGVDLFFVLSGFLITTRLLDEQTKIGSVDLRAFYVRRARRLLPALVATILLVLGVSVLVIPGDAKLHPSLETLSWTVLSALGYAYNWLVALNVPRIRALEHVWSLSVEEQFYIVWPLVFIAAMHASVAAHRVRQGLVLAILLSLSIPFWYWEWDWRRLYYGSDYRAHALLAGCWLATWRNDPSTRARLTDMRGLGAWAVLASSALGAIALSVDMDSSGLYMGGFAVVVAASAVVILWAVETPADHAVMRWLESRPIVWIGRRSYGGYLYHMPLVIWSRPLDLPVFDQVVLVCGGTFLLAEASYRLLERPVLEGRSPTIRISLLPGLRRSAAA